MALRRVCTLIGVQTLIFRCSAVFRYLQSPLLYGTSSMPPTVCSMSNFLVATGGELELCADKFCTGRRRLWTVLLELRSVRYRALRIPDWSRVTYLTDPLVVGNGDAFQNKRPEGWSLICRNPCGIRFRSRHFRLLYNQVPIFSKSARSPMRRLQLDFARSSIKFAGQVPIRTETGSGNAI